MSVETEIDDLVQRLVRLEDELERKLEARRAEFQYRIEEKRAVFEKSAIRQHKLIKIVITSYSIHYTKLYDAGRNHARAVARRRRADLGRTHLHADAPGRARAG